MTSPIAIDESYRKHIEKAKQYQKENPSKHTAYVREWIKKNREKVNQKQREYYAKNAEKMKEKFICDVCQGKYTRKSRALHNKTMKHIISLHNLHPQKQTENP